MAFNKIWDTDLVNDTLQRFRYGEDVALDCFHSRDPELKGENILFQLTHEEEAEFNKCATDVEYFVRTYCRFLTDYGRVTVELRDFQSDILQTLGEEVFIKALDDFGPKVRNYILMASRQTGKTTTISAFFAWYLCFHTDRNLLILANKQATTTEIVAKVVDVFRGLPFFMKPGIKSIGALGLRLDNGCMLTSQATTKTASIGFTIHVLYIDEFAHINQKLVKSFWRSVYPTLSSSLVSQCIISSTPDGMDNLFYEIWDKANTGKNTFKYKRVDYWEVPGHDDAWMEEIKANFGEEEFAQEYELLFDRKSNLLLTPNQLRWIKKNEKKYKYHELEKSSLSQDLYLDKLLWHPKFDPNWGFSKNDRFVLSNDIADGKDEDEEKKDNDFNITSIYKVEPKSIAKLRKLRKDERKIQNMFRMRQVGIFFDNFGDEEVMAQVNKAIVFDQLGGDFCKLVTEMNFNGKRFIDKFSDHDGYFEGTVMHSYHTAPVPGEKPPRRKAGFRQKQDKDFFCKLGRKLIDTRCIIPNDPKTINEFGSFGKVKLSWKGIAKHDDAAMACLNISRLYEEPEYGDWLFDFLQDLDDCPQKRYISELLKTPIETPEEISDEAFSALYGNEDNEMGQLQKIFQNTNKSKYSSTMWAGKR
jgi:hypothetical protein